MRHVRARGQSAVSFLVIHAVFSGAPHVFFGPNIREDTQKQNPGFPIKNIGNDRRGLLHHEMWAPEPSAVVGVRAGSL